MRILKLAVLIVLLLGLGAAEAADDAVWIDVRSAEEYSSGHVAEAVNIPYEEIAEGIQTLDVRLDQPIYLYCGSGRRAGIALESLQALGYTKVVNAGGLEDAQELIAGQAEATENP